MSDPDFTSNFTDAEISALSDAEANEADVIDQTRDDLSQTPEDVDEGSAERGYGDDAATEIDDANDFETGGEESGGDYDEEPTESDYDA